MFLKHFKMKSNDFPWSSVPLFTLTMKWTTDQSIAKSCNFSFHAHNLSYSFCYDTLLKHSSSGSSNFTLNYRAPE